MTSIWAWSRTAASNANADSGINWAEGQTAASVNDSARAMMGRCAELLDDLGATQTTAGTANAQTLTARSAFAALDTGLIVGFKAGFTNTGAATLNVNALGAKAIRKVTPGGESALAAGDITANGLFLVIYDAAANAAAGAWMLINPAAIASLGAANTFTASQTVSQAAASLVNLTNTTATPPLDTILGEVRFNGMDSLGNATLYGAMRGLVADNTDASEDGKIDFRTIAAGVAGVKLTIGAGLYTVNATGDDQGAGTINADAVYDDGVLLCAPIEEAKRGTYDATAWAALAPHDGLATYEAMKTRGYVPGSANSFAAELGSHEGIPGYWNRAEWQARLARTKPDAKGNPIIDRVSFAERHERLLLALDLQALAIADLTARIKALEAR